MFGRTIKALRHNRRENTARWRLIAPGAARRAEVCDSDVRRERIYTTTTNLLWRLRRTHRVRLVIGHAHHAEH